MDCFRSLLCDAVYQRSAVPGEIQGGTGKSSNRREEATSAVQTSKTMSKKDFRKQELLKMVALGNIEGEEELFFGLR